MSTSAAERAPSPHDESRRLQRLREYLILDSAEEAEFDEIAQLAAQLCETPMALVSLVDASRQWFKSHIGLELRETPREYSFCAHALEVPDLFIIPDATTDTRFASNPLVVGLPGIRFYAGAPLRSPTGEVLGTLCVLDRVPRTLSDEQQQTLRVLSNHVMTLLEHRRLAVLLEAERFRLTEAQAVAGMGSWDTDLTTFAVQWSEETHRIFGTDPATTSPTHEGFLDFVHPDDRQLVDQAFLASLEDPHLGPSRVEHRVLRADGTERFVEECWRIHRDSTGRPVRAVGSIQDRTERRKAAQDFLRAQRMESIGTLAGGIAHDLNNVFAPILLSSAMLKEMQPDEDAREMVALIETSAQRGADMVRQVLTFARGAEGRRVPVELRKLLQEAHSFVRETFPKRVRCELTLPDHPIEVIGDPTQLYQVLINLCVNARDAMPSGGTLTLSLGRSELDDAFVRAQPNARTGPHVTMEVADTGTGMSQAVQERIFDPFFTTKEVGQGTGLGLSTSLAIVRSHSGFVRVESTEGKGSRFLVYLPIDLGEHAATTPTPHAKPPHGHDELILIVDDEQSVRDMTSRSLRALGYRTLVAEDGREALQLFDAQASEIGLVVTDLMMPVLDGDALTRALLERRPALPIIITSGMSTFNDLSPERQSTIRAFLPKPYTADDLAAVVSNALSS